MLPVVAIVGAANVGKSTLFNTLTQTKDALVVDLPGTTRDRKYGEGLVGEHPYIVIDTGGVGDEASQVDIETSKQSWQAISEANCVLFVVNAQHGVTIIDEQLAKQIRKYGKQVILVLNKIDGINIDEIIGDFYSLGFDEPQCISAKNGIGVSKLAARFLSVLPEVESQVQVDEQVIKVAVVGQPNVGKSTLINRIIGEERLVVADQAGTTRDTIDIQFERDERKFLLFDTAGVRRKSRVKETVEKFSVVKALQAIDDSHVVLMMIDAQRGILDQDLSLLDFVLTTGRSLVILFNKWDGMPNEKKDEIKKTLEYRLRFVDFAKHHFISALHGSGVGEIYDSIVKAYDSSMRDLSTPELTRILESLLEKHQPPLVRGRRIKLRYAHSGGHNPQRVIIHGNQTDRVPDSYKKYLINNFSKILKLEGSPLLVEFKTGDNPYKDRRNKLTPRQKYKRDRLRKYTQKKEKK